MKSVSIQNAEEYQWGEGCSGWHLLKTDDLSVIQECVSAGRREVMHYHEESHQFFYILEGKPGWFLKMK